MKQPDQIQQMSAEDITNFIPTDLNEVDRGNLIWHVEHCNRCRNTITNKKKEKNDPVRGNHPPKD